MVTGLARFRLVREMTVRCCFPVLAPWAVQAKASALWCLAWSQN